MAIYDDDEFDSPDEALAHYRKLLSALQTHRRTLKIQLAEYGIAAPTHLRTEFDRVSSEVQQLRERIKQLEGGLPPARLYTLSSESGSQILLPAMFPAGDWADESPNVAQRAVLQMIHNFEQQSPNSFVEDTQVAGALNMDMQLVQDCMDVLQSDGDTTAANTFGGRSAMLTAQGRFKLRS